MDRLTQALDAVRANPVLGIGIGVAAVAAYLLLRRKPRIQREADERLSALRRDKTDRHTKPPLSR
jgi:hypothetical protein